MSSDLGDYLSSINYTKKDLMREAPDGVPPKYPAYIIRRLLSYHPDAVDLVSYMNIFHDLPPQMEYDFLREGMSKRKRFSRLEKEVKDTLDKIELISEYYACSNKKARDILNILTGEDLSEIKKELAKGGRTKN